MNDKELIRAARKGDKQAFLSLISPLESRLYQTGLGITGNIADAEDVWQNTVLKAFQSVRSLRSDYFSTWITRILLNEAKAVLRKRKREGVLPSLYTEAECEDLDVVHKAAIQACLSELVTEQREAILLRFWLDMPLSEIARSTKVPLSTAKTRLYQGIGSLKELLTKEELW